VAGPLQDLRLEGGDELLQVSTARLVVRLDAARVLLRLEQELEGVALGARVGFMPSTTSPYICTKRR
jgi:hypothetical protein